MSEKRNIIICIVVIIVMTGIIIIYNMKSNNDTPQDNNIQTSISNKGKQSFKNYALVYVDGLKTQLSLAAMGEGYSSLEKVPSFHQLTNDNPSFEIDISDMNKYIMDSAVLDSGKIIVEKNKETGKISYYVYKLKGKGYQTKETSGVNGKINIVDFSYNDIEMIH